MNSPASSRSEPFDVAVVALSARALAASARRAALKSLAIDLFADADTREHAALAVRAEAGRSGMGFCRRSLLAALEAHAPAGLPVVLGAGFEHAPGLMRAIAARNPILGATPDQVALLKDPFAFAALLGDLDIPHPPVRKAAPSPATLPPGREKGRPASRAAFLRSAPDEFTANHSRHARRAPGIHDLGAELDDFRKSWIPGLPAGHDGAWLSKRVGASGGAHIRSGGLGSSPAKRGRGTMAPAMVEGATFPDEARTETRTLYAPPPPPPSAVPLPRASHGGGSRGVAFTAGDRYLQAFIAGRAVSALFLADGRRASVVGFSEQWTDPARRKPFRYGGAVGPIDLPAPLAEDIASALDRLVAATGLTGLASADMVVSDDGDAYHLLEVNPRPGATLDVFDHGEAPSLLALHIDACAGRLPEPLPAPREARAAAVLYAERPTRVATLRRPLWTADWPSCDETLPAGAPVCTVLASAATPAAARARVTERSAALLASLRAAQKAAPKNANTNAMVPA